MSNYILSAALELQDRFSSKIKSASTSFKNFSSQVKTESASMGSSLKELGNQFGINSKGAISSFRTVERYGKVAGAAVTAFTGKSYLGWVELEDQLLRNAAISGATAKEQGKLNKQVIVQGRETRFTAKQVAEAQMYQAQSGKTVNEILEITPTLLKMSIASGDDLATTSDYLTDSMTAAGISIKDTTRYADLLANMSMRTNMTMSDMAETILKIGTLTKGQEKIEDIATMMGVLADNGIRSAEAGTAMKSIYGKLFQAQDDKKMQKLFKKYDLNLYKEVIGADGEKHIEWKGLLEIIEDMKPAFQNMNAAEQNYFLTTVAGRNHIDAFSALLKANNEQLEKSRNAANNAAGSLDNFYDTMITGSKQTLEEFKSAIDGFGNALGAAAAPIVDEKLKEMTSAINGVTENQLSTENIDKYIDHIILRAKQAAGVYVGLKATVAAAGTGATILGLGAGSITALALGGSALVGWGANKLRDVYMNSSSYNGDYMERIRLSREADTILKESKNRSFLNTGNSFGSLGAFNSEKYTKNKLSVGNFGDKEYLKTNGATPFNETKPEIKVDLSHLTLNTMKNTEELIKEVQERIGEEMRNAIANAQMTQQ